MVRWALSMVVALSAVVGLVGTATAAPPPPTNPGDAEIDAGRREAAAKAARVGELTGELADAEARLRGLTDDVAHKMELANKARVDLGTARDEADAAHREAEAARVEAAAAARAVDLARDRLDEFAAASFRQGSAVGSLSAYLGASSPRDLLARAQLLGAVGDSSLDALDDVERTRAEMANKDAAARAARDLADEKRAAADRAARDAEEVRIEAQRAQQDQAAAARAIQEDKARVEGELDRARGAVEGMEAQRDRYDRWLEEKRREEEEAAAAKPPPVPALPVTAPVTAPVADRVEVVVQRAMRQLGVRYSWGGGNYDGPTVGIRDWGVGDSYGDYYTVGFDCSGLMMYAFAGVGIRLPHYSGYQHNAGRKVPLSQARRGDMMFWGPGGGTHVALYLGGGMMIEAPYSGANVRVAPVRYGGILPYVTRLL